ncbi:MAG: HlyD family efflux transporter periplasmic adaptor subunit [Proteobacteria bacterium]|nr:HlyD family efflux transporter periplasmic adaptor subunit [Pseudomonadota bacterium]
MPTAGGGGDRAARPASAHGAKSANVSYLDQSLWKQLRDAETDEKFCAAWLTLQCRLIGVVTQAVVVLGEPDKGPYVPAAYWPPGQGSAPGLAAIAEKAMAERRGVIGDDATGGDVVVTGEGVKRTTVNHLAYPFVIDERLHGVVALTLDGLTKQQVQSVARQLQWGAVWIEAMFRRQMASSEEALSHRISTALDLVATALEEDKFQAATSALVTDLATRLGCDRVSIGVARRGHSTVVAMSHAAQFGKRMNLTRAIAQAMDEACDQEATVFYPAGVEEQSYVARAHVELAEMGDGGVILTTPLFAGEDSFGAITFECGADSPFDQDTVVLCESVAAVLGPILHAKRQVDRHIAVKLLEAAIGQLHRLFGPRHLGLKLAALGLTAMVAFFAVAEGDYRITAPITLEGKVQRAVVTPFEGYVKSAFARAGDLVAAGQVLAELDDTDLSLEHLRWTTERQQRLMEYDQALASHERADVNVIRAKIEQAAAQIALLDEHLSRAKLTAPFDGIVVSGDLSQSIGAPVQRGELLFEIAPLDAYRVILEVDEREIADLAVGQTGALVVSSAPDDPMPFIIERITPVSEAREGRNYFRVEARLTGDVDYGRLRPGMEGVGKVNVDSRLLFWIGTYRIVNWARLWLWKWVP